MERDGAIPTGGSVQTHFGEYPGTPEYPPNYVTLTIMGFRPVQFDEVAAKVAPLLKNLPRRLVAIDGRCGAGKSTIGRFLAWHFNLTLVETDLYLVGDGTLSRRTQEIDRVLRARLDRDRPVIVEGVGVLQVLVQLSRTPDWVLYVRNAKLESKADKFLLPYEREYVPWELADMVVEVRHDG